MKRNLWKDSTSPEQPSPAQGMLLLGGGPWGCGDAGDGGWASLGGFCHPKNVVRGRRQDTSAVSAATAWKPHRDHGTPGPWLDHKVLQKSRLGGVGGQVFGTEEENPQLGVSVASFSWECCSQAGCWSAREGELASSTGSRFDRTLGTWEETGKRAQSP